MEHEIYIYLYFSTILQTINFAVHIKLKIHYIIMKADISSQCPLGLDNICTNRPSWPSDGLTTEGPQRVSCTSMISLCELSNINLKY